MFSLGFAHEGMTSLPSLVRPSCYPLYVEADLAVTESRGDETVVGI